MSGHNLAVGIGMMTEGSYYLLGTFLLALFTGVFALWGGKRLERYKSKQKYQGQRFEKEVEAISNVRSQLDQLEKHFSENFVALNRRDRDQSAFMKVNDSFSQFEKAVVTYAAYLPEEAKNICWRTSQGCKLIYLMFIPVITNEQIQELRERVRTGHAELTELLDRTTREGP